LRYVGPSPSDGARWHLSDGDDQNDGDQALQLGKEEREKQNPMGSRQRYK
jgi:hypothetical protein